jgi:dihydroflavonol-4-reductase
MGTLLIGATGLVGANLAHLLCGRKERVRALCRLDSDRRGLRGLPIEEVEGDILNPSSLHRAMEGMERVYHCAGVVRFAPRAADLLRRVHLDGTANILRAARRAKVRRVVMVSSVAAIAKGPMDAPGTEDQPLDTPPPSPYHATKREAERVALEEASGVQLVIANPSLVLGPHDVKPTSGALLLAAARGLIRAYPAGGTNAVNAADVAVGLDAAMQRGRTGERYILGGDNLTYRDLFAMAAEEAGAPAPRVLVPKAAVNLAHRVAGLAFALPLARSLDPGVSTFQVLNEGGYVSSDKAIRELGYAPTSVRLGIRAALRWFQEEGALPKDQPLTPRGVVRT